MENTEHLSPDTNVRSTLSLIIPEQRLPKNVFSTSWNGYLFFESDELFKEEFIETKNLILDAESSPGLVMVNIGNTLSVFTSQITSIFLTRSTDYAEYKRLLFGDGTACNWIFLMDRYVCSSSKSNWCIYCEKENDFAVFAFNKYVNENLVLNIKSIMNAYSLNDVINGTFKTPFDELVPEWQSGLRMNYRD